MNTEQSAFMEAVARAASEAGVSVRRLLEANARMEAGKATREDKAILVHMLPKQKRPCGECTMCCTAPAIEDSVLDPEDPNDVNFTPKPACASCQFANKGCTIYENRPSICKSYQCLWSMGLIDVANYPMKRGVAWTIQPCAEVPGKGLVVGHCHDVDAVMRDPYSVNVVAGFLQHPQFHGITVRDDKQAVCFMRDGVGARALIDPSDKMRMRILLHTEQKFNYSFA